MPLGCDAAGCGSQDHGTGRGGLHDHLWPPLTGCPCGAERADTCPPTCLVNAPKTPDQVRNRAGGERPLSPTDPQGVEAAFALLSAAQRSNDLHGQGPGNDRCFFVRYRFHRPAGPDRPQWPRCRICAKRRPGIHGARDAGSSHPARSCLYRHDDADGRALLDLAAHAPPPTATWHFHAKVLDLRLTLGQADPGLKPL